MARLSNAHTKLENFECVFVGICFCAGAFWVMLQHLPFLLGKHSFCSWRVAEREDVSCVALLALYLRPCGVCSCKCRTKQSGLQANVSGAWFCVK